ncbi:MAG: flgB [Symbiobacteriaceae bacterium]|jgi:flagellar basal-body rod protein FlgB|nr:flgB [Symbiobacteriaceae bacterium]
MVGNDLTARLLERGIEASGLRQRMQAHNIANMNTPGFKRTRVEFEQHLASALAEGKDPDGVRPVVVTEETTLVRPDGNNTDVEAEMAALAENQLWYAALTRQLSDHFARLRMVIHDGRR